ncbi:PREDICTED: peroxisomal biogenesis factor 19 [Nicrophorus vespilloides]|uniref:Peroxin-19 n=1 Tax=Nicrophorus vespilloides TaxID=110193 RepID=A0ABM1MBI3_NICVS|nr:PREDICTED: peroxisomal biogenesis factor 19 [Nicrophorus vespilloides]
MSDQAKQEEKKPAETDAELSELLDSALADFSKKPEEKAEKSDEAKAEEVEGQEWSEDFIKQASEQFESNIAALLGSGNGEQAVTPEQIQDSFQRMAEAAQSAFSNPGIGEPVTNDFASAISQTLQGLSQGAENLQNPLPDSAIMEMFSGMADGGGSQNAFLPFMQGMMQSLLSKEVLYPSLMDILEKYPVWLAENDGTLSEEDKTRYKKQQELMQSVCDELEPESNDDSIEVKKARFDKVLALMQTLQDYGQPPADIVVNGPAIPGMDQQGNMDQCSLM